MKLFFMFFVLVISSVEANTLSDSILESQPDQQLDMIQPKMNFEEQYNTENKSDSIVIKNDSFENSSEQENFYGERRKWLTFSLTPNYEEHKLIGTGFNINLPYEIGKGFGFKFDYWNQSFLYGFYFEGKYQKTTFNGLTSLSPQQMSVERTTYVVAAQFAKLWFTNLNFIFGYKVADLDSEITRPNVAVASFQTYGFVAGPKYWYRVNESLTSEFFLTYYYPLHYSEENITTGNFESYREIQFGGRVLKSINPRLNFSVGGSVSLEKAEFSSIGNRGVSSGKVTSKNFTLPLSLEWLF